MAAEAEQAEALAQAEMELATLRHALELAQVIAFHMKNNISYADCSRGFRVRVMGYNPNSHLSNETQ